MGFTLIELMIVLLVVALLAAIALPAYHGQVRKSRRAEAIAAMSQVQQAQERWRANRSSYADRLIVKGGALAGVGSAADAGAAASVTTAGGYYALSLSDVGPVGYTIVAAGQGSQVEDAQCRYLQMTLAGGNIVYNSGTTSGTGNGADSAPNKRCWNR